MEFETTRYKFAVTELQAGGPGGYESVYLTSEGSPAVPSLYSLLNNYEGSLLPAHNNALRQRNGEVLVSSLEEGKSVGIASGFKPSGAYHFGHKLTSEAVGFLQRNGVQVFVPVADVESEMDSKLTREEYQFWAADNLLDWGANGVDNLSRLFHYVDMPDNQSPQGRNFLKNLEFGTGGVLLSLILILVIFFLLNYLNVLSLSSR